MRIAPTLVAAATLLAALVAAPAISAPDPHLRLRYTAPAGETGRTVLDQSGRGNNGTRHGGVTRVRGAYRFHRISLDRHRFDRIRAPDSPSLSPGTQMFSYGVRLLVRPNAEWMNSEMAVLRHGDGDFGTGGNYKMELKKLASGTVVATCVMHDTHRQGVGYVRGHPGIKKLDDGHWHTVVCSRTTPGTVSLTIDGRTTTRPVRGTMHSITGQASLLIGCQRNPGGHRREQFVGKLDNIVIATQ